ncbi:hypothetical protein [Cellulomonas shaoxiangyii]|uniref:Uncharacterized protein n=1 Tax=Cellulomonas shaoxiangyii TaxID=2566013 RepID=A0A4P7SNF1_9CELL|nr:hypothetical protein [Cellulomonas shaoxiangyii]QCB94133.1 hypothetical protein E5225_11755 [Cellulomonas shaoxiangyii]TGY86626.1 hypothetical protein E5226_00715 [Cellulomonas shaoxiangyii]
MSAPTPTPDAGAQEPAAPRTRRWATLTPEALRDEIDANRRSERWVVVASASGAAVTAVAVVLQAVTR